ncbi:MAG: leucyl aminopeptidase [Deferribacterota bacterium]|nr:leucyl aminopeptidase [Deferribacterota bacterium]
MKVIIQKKEDLKKKIEYPVFVPFKKDSLYLKEIFGEDNVRFFENLIKANKGDSDNRIKTAYIRDGAFKYSVILYSLEFTYEAKDFLIAGKKAITFLKDQYCRTMYYIPFEDVLEISDSYEFSKSFIEGLFYGSYFFERYKSDKKEFSLDTLNIVTSNKKIINFIENGYDYIPILFKHIDIARNLINEPANEITPSTFSEYVRLNSNKNIDIQIWDDKEIEQRGFNLISAVGRGSKNKQRFIKMRYEGKENRDFIYVVGKGVTFDSGGTNLKPTGFIETMKSDMSGAAIAYSIINLLADLNVRCNIISLIPLVENSVSADSYKPGDIYKSYSGKTVEILNTDAEGRLILADSLAYAVKNNNARLIIDIATLTGAMVVALGSYCAGYFTNDEDLSTKFIEASKRAREDFYRLPLYKGYKDRIKSKIADLQNISKDKREAGAIIAALFLQEFVGTTPWLHLDIAGPAFLTEEHPIYGSGATSFGLKTLYELISKEYDIKNKR